MYSWKENFFWCFFFLIYLCIFDQKNTLKHSQNVLEIVVNSLAEMHEHFYNAKSCFVDYTCEMWAYEGDIS